MPNRFAGYAGPNRTTGNVKICGYWAFVVSRFLWLLFSERLWLVM